MVQEILSCCESINSDLSVFLDPTDNHYYIYLGVALLEKISIDPSDLRHKMLIGRLYNGGAKLSVLKERFNHDPRTIKVWGNALLSNDPEEMSRAFTGRSGKLKATPELIRYVRQQYRNRSVLGTNYRQVIIRNTEEVFGVRISESLASSLFLRDKNSSNMDAAAQPEEAVDMSISGQSEPPPRSNSASPVQQSPSFPLMGCHSKKAENILVQHAGLILFGHHLEQYDPFQSQMICQLLQGALNVERSKSLCFDSLRFFNYNVIPVLRSQRVKLGELSTVENTLDLYRRNSAILSDGPGKGDIFYFDPHSKKYTGQLKTMKGWCGSAHSVSKVINLDSFHTQSGRPCYIQHYSPYYDMRERFFMSLELFDQLFPEEKRSGRTFIIDRGIYGAECFLRFKDDYLITWEKGYKEDGWNDTQTSIKFTRSKQKNNKRSKRIYSFECQEEEWKRNSSFRRIIVKATNYRDSTITVSILCSNPTMSVQDAVWLICNRWLQENDFKLLGEHFGINQMDSRQHSSFEEKAEEFADREADSRVYKAVKKRMAAAARALANHLLKLNQAEKKRDQFAVEETKACTDPKALTALKSKRSRNEKQLKKLREEKPALERNLELAEAKQIEALRKESRKQQLIDGSYKLLDIRRKAYMDALRINAANLFRNLHERYRTLYDDYRDDHFYLRILTRSSGMVSYCEDHITVKLWLPGSLQRRTVEALQALTSVVQNEINNRNRKITKELRIRLQTGVIQP